MYEWMKWMRDVRERRRGDPSEKIEGAIVHLVS